MADWSPLSVQVAEEVQLVDHSFPRPQLVVEQAVVRDQEAPCWEVVVVVVRSELGVAVARQHCPSSRAAWGDGRGFAAEPDCCTHFHEPLGAAGPALEAAEGLTDEAQERPAAVVTVEREMVEEEDLRSCGTLTIDRLLKRHHRSSRWMVWKTTEVAGGSCQWIHCSPGRHGLPTPDLLC